MEGERRTFGVFEMDDVDAGMVGPVVADVAEMGAAVGKVSVSERGERESVYRAALGLKTMHMGHDVAEMSVEALYW